jgi:hypothetical protein
MCPIVLGVGIVMLQAGSLAHFWKNSEINFFVLSVGLEAIQKNLSKIYGFTQNFVDIPPYEYLVDLVAH